MLRNEKEKKICKLYKRDKYTGLSDCKFCPLTVYREAFMCLANSHLNKATGEWVMDSVLQRDDALQRLRQLQRDRKERR